MSMADSEWILPKCRYNMGPDVKIDRTPVTNNDIRHEILPEVITSM